VAFSDLIRNTMDAFLSKKYMADGLEKVEDDVANSNSTAQQAVNTSNDAKTQVDANKNQIANIVAHGGEGSLEEIVDVRTGADGTVHASAGDHVRSIDESLADITKEKYRKEVA
jgi:hypothetical protein